MNQLNGQKERKQNSTVWCFWLDLKSKMKRKGQSNQMVSSNR
jgi:hypothetical protein